MRYAIKTKIGDPNVDTLHFPSEKTMYGGKRIASGDVLFLFDSETQGGKGLIGKGIVSASRLLPRKQAGTRETPRVSVSVAHLARATKSLGRDQVKSFTDWNDGQPETELNFKFYRQGTNKIVGISDQTAAYLENFF
jgi:hypothetical protein